MTCSDEDHCRSRRHGAEGRGWLHRLGTRCPGDREVGWRCVQPAPCTWRREARVSWLSLKTKVNGFSSVCASKPMAMVCESVGLKTTRTVFTGLFSKPMATVSGSLASKPATTVSGSLASKPAATVFSGLASKPVATVFSSLASKLVTTVSPGLASKSVVGFLVEPQNQGGAGFPSFGLKTGSYGLVICASKSSRRFLGLGLKIKQALVCWLRHKTNGQRFARDRHRDLAGCFT
jgi:hypothetical protein